MKAKTEELKYEEALLELEGIVRQMEQGQSDIDQLTTQLKRAQQLLALCRDRLTKTDAEVKKLLGT
ncbi:MAG: exodeoxyribonuclease VII small subunit [Prevotella sp.]|jgi:exodeoxyribonuclease VII small subunit|nr:exodeoxyribonuclease VII small subunit [Prevotella sp.]